MAGVKGRLIALRQEYLDSSLSTYKTLKVYTHDYSHTCYKCRATLYWPSVGQHKVSHLWGCSAI